MLTLIFQIDTHQVSFQYREFPGSLKQFIPNNPDLWELEKYEKFFEVRQLITNEMNAFLTDL